MLTNRQTALLARIRMFGSLNMWGKNCWDDVKTLAKLGYVQPVSKLVYEYVKG